MSAGPATESPSSENPDFLRVPNYLWQYANDHANVTVAAAELQRYLEELAVEASIPVHTIESRAKSFQSYQNKAEEKRAKGEDPAAVIQDCVAARVILFTTRARADLVDVIRARVVGPPPHNPGQEKWNGYDSEHVIITELSDEGARLRYPALTQYLSRYPGCEVQLRSVAAHAWAEYEHDVRYKAGAYADLSERDRKMVDQLFVEAGGMRRYMDKIFDEIENALHPLGDKFRAGALVEVPDDPHDDPDAVDEQDTQRVDVETLSRFIGERFPEYDVGDALAVREIVDHLESMKVRTIGQLEAALLELESGRVATLMDYPVVPTGARALDDELLAVYGERYVASALDEDRRQLLALRLRRVRGKFSIYSVYDGHDEHEPVAAARAVRELVKIVADSLGLGAVLVEGAIAQTHDALPPSMHPRTVETEVGPLHVVTNLTRTWAEDIMRTLVSRASGLGLRVTRAGDVICESPGS